MSMRILLILGLSCLAAACLAVWVYLAGGGLILAFLTYSLGGSLLVVVSAGVAMVVEPFRTAAATPRLSSRS